MVVFIAVLDFTVTLGTSIISTIHRRKCSLCLVPLNKRETGRSSLNLSRYDDIYLLSIIVFFKETKILVK